jgi:biotin carboxyl carrier protein
MRARRVFARTPLGTFAVQRHDDGRAVVHALEPGAAGDPVSAEPTTAPLVDAHVQYAGHGRVRLTVGGRRTLAWAVDAGDTRWVFIEGDVVQVEMADRLAPAGRRDAHGAESLAAPMPATVVRILVAPGQTVRRGETLVLLEAMKMEMPLRAPHEAIVKTVRCREGELVQPGVVLIDLEA